MSSGNRILALVLAVATYNPLPSAAENWPQWRGEGSNGVGAEGAYPVKFSSTDGVAWKVRLPGLGMSTPIVWDDRIFITCGIDGRDGVVTYDMSGKELWRQQFGEQSPGKHQNGSGSNPSPVTDGANLVVYYKSGTLACLDLAGKVKWQKNLQEQYGAVRMNWDLGTSPLIVGDRVIVAVMHAGESYLVALNVNNGEVMWKTARQYQRSRESDEAYTTPQLVKLDGREVLVTWGADHLTAHDAKDGKLLWEMGGFNTRNQGGWRVIASPGIGGDVALVPFGRGRYLAGIKLGIEKPTELWRRGEDERGISADSPTPIIQGDSAYVLSDGGRFERLELATGKTTWSFELPRGRGRFFASPVLAGGKIYAARDDGKVFVVEAVQKDGTWKAELLSENDMGEKLIATPTPIRGGLLVRGVDHLFWIANKAG